MVRLRTCIWCWSWWIGKLAANSWLNGSCSRWIRTIEFSCVFAKACKLSCLSIYWILRDASLNVERCTFVWDSLSYWIATCSVFMYFEHTLRFPGTVPIRTLIKYVWVFGQICSVPLLVKTDRWLLEKKQFWIMQFLMTLPRGWINLYSF